MKIAIFLFDGVTALDPVGVYDSLARLPMTDIVFITETGAECSTGDGFLGLRPGAAVSDISEADILLVPGGSPAGLQRCMTNTQLLAQLARIDKLTKITGSVCTGSLILGAAGLLKGRSATTNWRAKDYLARFGATYTGERVTRSDKYWTSAGVTAGIDLGLTICGEIAGTELAEAVELAMEYDPSPPFGTGNPKTATPEQLKIVQEVLRG